MKLKISVPATIANLGSGHDSCCLATDWHNQLYVENATKTTITIRQNFGTTPGQIPNSQKNLFYKSFAFLFNQKSAEVPPVKIKLDLNFPPGRGLGGSASAVVGGLLAANGLLDNYFSKKQLLDFAANLEHGQHPDNVAAALFGGLVIVAKYENGLVHTRIAVPSDIKAVFFIPDFTTDTALSRSMLPSQYSREDLIFNSSRVALLLSAFTTKQYDLLKIAMEDKVHQPTRAKMFPLIPELIQAANKAGALGTALCGSGPSIVALANDHFSDIALAFYEVSKKHKLEGKIIRHNLSNKGAFVSEL